MTAAQAPRIRLEVPLSTRSWLLKPKNPSVRFFALRDLLGRSDSAAEVRQARRAIMDRGLVPRILDKQASEGCWGRPEDFYIRSKYSGTVWTLIYLAALGVDGSDPRVRRACEFILRFSQDRTGGGFSYLGTARRGGTPSGVIPCLTGNMIWCLLRFGMIDDPRVQRAIDWSASTLRFDDGDTRPPRMRPYLTRERCWGRHTCFDAVVKPLKALAAIPRERRGRRAEGVIAQAREFILLHHLYKRSHGLDRVAKPKWLRLGFPLMWDTDILEMLEILADLGPFDLRMRDALDALLSKAGDQGRWTQQQTPSVHLLVPSERMGRPSKWLTVRALTVIRKLGGRIVWSGC